MAKVTLMKRARIDDTMDDTMDAEDSFNEDSSSHNLNGLISKNVDSPLAGADSRNETEGDFVTGNMETNDDISSCTLDRARFLERDDHPDNETKTTEESNQTDSVDLGTTQEEMDIKRNREAVLRGLSPQLEDALTKIRATTKTLFNAVEEYMKEIESIEIDYSRVRASQNKEACRLADVEPDVSRVAECFSKFKRISHLSE
jgi:hypothetical protein